MGFHKRTKIFGCLLVLLVGAVFVARRGTASPVVGKGERLSFELHTAKVSVEVPEGWETVKDLYNLPLSILSPDHSSDDPGQVEDFQARRSMVAIIPTGAQNVILPVDGMKRDEKAYYANRKTDLEQDGAVVLTTKPYHHESFSKTSVPGMPRDIHTLGISYRVGDKVFLEYSNYVICDFQIYLLKAILHAEDQKEDELKLNQVVRSFQCK
jgi:hypothetical protein